MKRARILFLLPMAILEIACILVGWGLAVFHTGAAAWWIRFWNSRWLPDPEWYTEGWRS